VGDNQSYLLRGYFSCKFMKTVSRNCFN
jgi:hypothetical protein